MIKKRKLVFDKTTYVFERFSIGGAAGAFTQTFHIYIDKEFSEYSLVAECIGYSSDAKYLLYKGDILIAKVGNSDMYLPFGMVADSIKIINLDLYGG
jgi:hypothetical protein